MSSVSNSNIHVQPVQSATPWPQEHFDTHAELNRQMGTQGTTPGHTTSVRQTYNYLLHTDRHAEDMPELHQQGSPMPACQPAGSSMQAALLIIACCCGDSNLVKGAEPPIVTLDMLAVMPWPFSCLTALASSSDLCQRDLLPVCNDLTYLTGRGPLNWIMTKARVDKLVNVSGTLLWNVAVSEAASRGLLMSHYLPQYHPIAEDVSLHTYIAPGMFGK